MTRGGQGGDANPCKSRAINIGAGCALGPPSMKERPYLEIQLSSILTPGLVLVFFDYSGSY